MVLWALWAGCAEPPDEILLYAEGDGRVCVDAAGASLTVTRYCAVTCVEATFQGRCEAALRTFADGTAVVLTSEILVKQPEACPSTECTTLSVSCPLPPDADGLPIVWGDDTFWNGVDDLDVCVVAAAGDTG